MYRFSLRRVYQVIQYTGPIWVYIIRYLCTVAICTEVYQTQKLDEDLYNLQTPYFYHCMISTQKYYLQSRAHQALDRSYRTS